MSTQPFSGTLVRLGCVNPETDGALLSTWSRDSEYSRLQDSGPAYPWSARQVKNWLEKDHEMIQFSIQTLVDGKVVGFIDLSGISWTSGEAWVGIGIGEREQWGKGYGTDAMNILLRYAFRELNLNRVSLTVFEYNPRGIRSYEKCGFKHEGRMRAAMNRDGRRWDLLFMGCLREEWEALQG